MSKVYQKGYPTDVYASIRATRMSEAERLAAVKAMQDAEAIAEALIWVRDKFAALGNFFLHPSLKH